MNEYYVNNRAQANGDHEVHKEGCQYMPSERTFVGRYASCFEAVAAANITFPERVDGCKYCSSACHKH